LKTYTSIMRLFWYYYYYIILTHSSAQ